MTVAFVMSKRVAFAQTSTYAAPVMRWGIFFAALVALTPCFGSNPSPPGPQPYLLFNVINDYGIVVGTLSAHTDFEFSVRSHDGSDFVTMHARLLNKTSNGFRFSWSVVHRSHDKVVARIRERPLVPWGTTTSLKSIPGYHVKVFYSHLPANEHSNARSA
jgi:hypothetical protein